MIKIYIFKNNSYNRFLFYNLNNLEKYNET